jgi:hypothetical protein
MKKIILALAVATVAVMAVVGSASADVARYQSKTGTLVVSLTDAQPGNHHTFAIAWTNPCGTDGAFTGTGQGSPEAGGATESITGTLVDDHLTFAAVYDSSSFLPGYTWSYDGSLSGAALGDQATGYHATAVVTTTTSSFRNHGAYVSSMGGGDDAAHSCIGMPIH